MAGMSEHSQGSNDARGDDRAPANREQTGGGERGETERREDRSRRDESVEFVATSTVRIGFLALGFLILLYAVGQIVGLNLLAMLSSALDTPEVRWTIVAIFGVVLIVLAFRGFTSR